MVCAVKEIQRLCWCLERDSEHEMAGALSPGTLAAREGGGLSVADTTLALGTGMVEWKPTELGGITHGASWAVTAPWSHCR